MAEIGKERLEKDGIHGWIVDTSNKDENLVRFLRGESEGLEVLCDVVFPATGSPHVTVPSERKLPEQQRLKARALDTSKNYFMKHSMPWCGGNPNTVVLDDPSGTGFLVFSFELSRPWNRWRLGDTIVSLFPRTAPT